MPTSAVFLDTTATDADDEAEGKFINEFYTLPDLASYLQSGALVEFILEQNGHASMRTLWNTLAVERTLRTTIPELERNWHVWLRATPGALPDIDHLKERGCG